jgi:hypothetical protein
LRSLSGITIGQHHQAAWRTGLARRPDDSANADVALQNHGGMVEKRVIANAGAARYAAFRRIGRIGLRRITLGSPTVRRINARASRS